MRGLAIELATQSDFSSLSIVQRRLYLNKNESLLQYGAAILLEPSILSVFTNNGSYCRNHLIFSTYLRILAFKFSSMKNGPIKVLLKISA